MRHDEGNTLKSQDNYAGLRALPLNRVECGIDQVDRRSVSCGIDRWHTRGFVGFYDQPDAGRPPILSIEEQPMVQQSLQPDPED